MKFSTLDGKLSTRKHNPPYRYVVYVYNLPTYTRIGMQGNAPRCIVHSLYYGRNIEFFQHIDFGVTYMSSRQWRRMSIWKFLVYLPSSLPRGGASIPPFSPHLSTDVQTAIERVVLAVHLEPAEILWNIPYRIYYFTRYVHTYTYMLTRFDGVLSANAHAYIGN